MGIFVKGEVVVLPFPFSDLSDTKRRPALVLAVPKDDEIIVCQITKQYSRPEYVIPLSHTDFSCGGLKVDSFVRPNQIFMAEPRIVKFSVGKLKPEKLKEIIEAVICILRDK